MNRIIKTRRSNRWHRSTFAVVVLAIFGLTSSFGVQDARAQQGGLPDGGDFGGGDDFGGDGGDFGGGDFGGGGGGAGGAGGGGSAFGEDPGFGEVLGGAAAADVRNQGFVGATGERIQQEGFVGPPGESSGPPLVDGASFGGGVNDVDLGGGGGGGGGGGNQNNGSGGSGQQGTAKGFEVFRSSVRANLRPRFAAPKVRGFEIADRFQNRIRRQPKMGSDGSGVQISIEGITATMTGIVSSAQESARIERQLRLEPGVYKIENRTTVSQ